MTFNKFQKILTVLYFAGLIVILLFFTPYSHYDSFFVKTSFYFGNFFKGNDLIVYTKFFIEIGILTIIYFLSIIILKRKPKQ